LAPKTRDKRSRKEMFIVGPQLHLLEGAALVTPVKLSMDVATGHFDGELRWAASDHSPIYNVLNETACLTLQGYANAVIGRFILFKEVRCTACGDDHCKIAGRPIDDWTDGAGHKRHFEDPSLLETIDTISKQVEAIKSALELAAC
jgi:hypothetical protein